MSCPSCGGRTTRRGRCQECEQIERLEEEFASPASRSDRYECPECGFEESDAPDRQCWVCRSDRHTRDAEGHVVEHSATTNSDATDTMFTETETETETKSDDNDQLRTDGGTPVDGPRLGPWSKWTGWRVDGEYVVRCTGCGSKGLRPGYTDHDDNCPAVDNYPTKIVTDGGGDLCGRSDCSSNSVVDLPDRHPPANKRCAQHALSDAVDGVGDVTAAKILDEIPLEKLVSRCEGADDAHGHPVALARVDGIGATRAASIAQSVDDSPLSEDLVDDDPEVRADGGQLEHEVDDPGTLATATAPDDTDCVLYGPLSVTDGDWIDTWVLTITTESGCVEIELPPGAMYSLWREVRGVPWPEAHTEDRERHRLVRELVRRGNDASLQMLSDAVQVLRGDLVAVDPQEVRDGE